MTSADHAVPTASADALLLPVCIAGIDVGATSARLQIAEIQPDWSRRTLELLVHPISLGNDTFRTGLITPDSMRALCKVLTNFNKLLRQYEVVQYRAVGTSAVREATNRDFFLDRVHHASGIRLEALDSVAEERMTYQALQPFLRDNNIGRDKHTLVIDLGGGSTQIMVLQDESIVLMLTRRLGAVRPTGDFSLQVAPQSPELQENAINKVVSATAPIYNAYPIREVVVINPLLADTFCQLPAAVRLPGGFSLSVEAIQLVFEDVLHLRAEKLAKRYDLRIDEVEVLVPTVLGLHRFVQTLDVDRVYFAELGLLDALLLDQILVMKGQDPRTSFKKQIISSSMAIADKYRYDKRHSVLVRKLANQLFAALGSFLDLTEQDRLYLEVASLLHDIGKFVSDRDYHKHGAYLIRNTEIIGLTSTERELVSLIVRYSRKGRPRSEHDEFISVPLATRMRVTKLASLLRIANALDASHLQAIISLRPELDETSLILYAEGQGSWLVEEAALKANGALFEEVTGLTIHLRRSLR